jgi:hypothetical protein
MGPSSLEGATTPLLGVVTPSAIYFVLFFKKIIYLDFNIFL